MEYYLVQLRQVATSDRSAQAALYTLGLVLAFGVDAAKTMIPRARFYSHLRLFRLVGLFF